MTDDVHKNPGLFKHLLSIAGLVVAVLIGFVLGLQFGAVTLMPMIMVTDCVDAEEYRTGKRREGPAFSVLTLTIKVCLAVGAVLTVGVLLILRARSPKEASEA